MLGFLQKTKSILANESDRLRENDKWGKSVKKISKIYFENSIYVIFLVR